MQPPPAGSRPTPAFHQPHVEFGMGLANRSMQGNLAAAAEREVKRRNHDRLGRELDRLRHALEGADHLIDFVPLLLLHGHQQQHEVGPHGKIRARRW